MEVTIDNTEHLLVNTYNANTEKDQLKTLQNLPLLLENFDNFFYKNVKLAGDFNLFSSKKLEYKRGRRQVLKKQSVSHIIKLQEAYNFCDVWLTRNPRTKSFPFRQNYPTYIGLLIYFKQSSRNNFKRRYFQCILITPFPSFLFKLYQRPGFLEIL